MTMTMSDARRFVIHRDKQISNCFSRKSSKQVQNRPIFCRFLHCLKTKLGKISGTTKLSTVICQEYRTVLNCIVFAVLMQRSVVMPGRGGNFHISSELVDTLEGCMDVIGKLESSVSVGCIYATYLYRCRYRWVYKVTDSSLDVLVCRHAVSFVYTRIYFGFKSRVLILRGAGGRGRKASHHASCQQFLDRESEATHDVIFYSLVLSFNSTAFHGRQYDDVCAHPRNLIRSLQIRWYTLRPVFERLHAMHASSHWQL